jgi:hypothetical protein
MAKRVFLDIETLPPGEEYREQVAAAIARDAGAQEDSLEDYEIARLIDERFRGLALQGEYGRLLAIGIILEDDSTVMYRGLLGRDRETGSFHLDEARTLKAFWRLLRDFDDRHDMLIGHNLLDFDLQFLCKRSVIHSIRPSFDVCFARFKRRPVFDTMWEWTHWRKCIGLSELANILGLSDPKSQGVDGGKVYDLYQAGNHGDIALYCMRDVECVREIYYRLNYTQAAPLEPYVLDAGTLKSPAVTGAC